MKNSADQGGVIHRGRRPRWITPSQICKILHILRKLNSVIALLFIQNISPFLKEFRHFALCQRFNNLQRAALFKFGQQQLVIVN